MISFRTKDEYKRSLKTIVKIHNIGCGSNLTSGQFNYSLESGHRYALKLPK